MRPYRKRLKKKKKKAFLLSPPGGRQHVSGHILQVFKGSIDLDDLIKVSEPGVANMIQIVLQVYTAEITTMMTLDIVD